MEIFLLIFTISLSTYLIWRASESFDIASTYLTRNLNEGIKGPTINAIASSLPELIISFLFIFYLKDIEGFSAGFATIIGSSIFNITMIPVLSLLFIYFKKGRIEFPIEKNIILQDGIFLIVAEIILFVCLYLGGVSIYLSTILIIFYLIYICVIFNKRNKSSKSFKKKFIVDEKNLINNTSLLNKILSINIACIVSNNSKMTTFKAYLILLISLTIISIACRELVISSEQLSEILNLNLFLISFLIAAIATSIPDTILSMKDAGNKKYKDAFSNAYGSNIFDICIGIGLPALIYLIINNKQSLSTESILNNNIVMLSSGLLVFYTILITLIYWIKPLNIFRSLIIFILFFTFIGLISYII